VDPSHWRKGIGGRLYGELLGRLGQSGCHVSYAGVALPNEASVRLHRAARFEPIGVFREAGRKFDRWHDVAWFQKRL